MNKASFSLTNYKFEKVLIETANLPADISIDFSPEGVYYKEKSEYDLKFVVTAFDEKKGQELPFVQITCVANFKLMEVNSLEEIPTYFYKNSIAIVFPFIRAFISSVTLQCNIQPIILPTLNLSSLELPLKQNTKTQ